MKRLAYLLPLIFLYIAYTALPGKFVTQNQYAESWPFTVERGFVYSVGDAAIFCSDGVEYQLNVIANVKGYASINPIWREDPNRPGTRVNLGPFIDLALKTPR